MSVMVKIPTQMREVTAGQAEIAFDSVSTVGELLKSLGGAHPDLVARIVDEGGQLRRFINLYVGDEDVRFLDGLDTKLEDGSVISILPAVAGGAAKVS